MKVSIGVETVGVEASLVADGTERGKPVHNAESDFVRQPTPLLSRRSDSITHFGRHQHGFDAQGFLLKRESLKTTITASQHSVPCLARFTPRQSLPRPAAPVVCRRDAGTARAPTQRRGGPPIRG